MRKLTRRRVREAKQSKAKESAESVFAALETAPVLCLHCPTALCLRKSTMTVPYCALKCAVPSVPFGNTVPHCALERAPDQTLRFGWGKHFSLPPTCAIVEIFLFARRSNHQIFSSQTSLSWWSRGETCALEWILVKGEIFARCNSCHDFTAQNLREPWVSQIFVKAASDICCDIEIYGSHWVRPLWNWAPCAGKQLCHITDCFMGSFKQHRNILLTLSPLLFRHSDRKHNWQTIIGTLLISSPFSENPVDPKIFD